MITKMPRWVWTGGWVLAFIAGIVNVVGLLGFGHEPITHLTGNTTRLAEAIAMAHGRAVLHISALMSAFVAGTVISGFLIQDSVLRIGRRYSVALLLESVLLFIAMPLLRRLNPMGMYACACAMGLQNAMATTYSGAAIRTTHLSGMFTDLGISIGHAVRGVPVNSKRVVLSLVVISGFLVGGVIGAMAFKRFEYGALLFPAILTALAAVFYGIIRTHKKTKGLA